MAGWKGFWESHRCETRCSLLHGNYVGHKRLMERLKADPTGASCRKTLASFEGRSDFRAGTADARMLGVIAAECCRG